MPLKQTSQLEFIALMAALMSVVALAIDALLPALDVIGLAVGTESLLDNQLLITMIFLGLGVGPLLFGPLSDSLGRKPIVYIGFAIFILSSFVCVYAQSIEVMIAGRILQGIGLSSPRTIAIAIIRDRYSGDYMARIISFVTVVFLLVPIIAPAMGKLILDVHNWQGIFYIQIGIALLVAAWFWKRQPETLSEAHKIPFNFKVITNGFKVVFRNKITMGYTVISGFVVGSFLVYLSSAQQIFQMQYGLKDAFPYIFAGLAISVGLAVFLNGTFVVRYGMKRLVSLSFIIYFVTSLLYVLLFLKSDNPGLVVVLTFFGIQLFSVGFIFGNLRALAMEPVGHLAGMGASVNGFISTIMAVPISTFIGSYIKDTALPLFIGFAICSFLCLVLLFWLRNEK